MGSVRCLSFYKRFLLQTKAVNLNILFFIKECSSNCFLRQIWQKCNFLGELWTFLLLNLKTFTVHGTLRDLYGTSKKQDINIVLFLEVFISILNICMFWMTNVSPVSVSYRGIDIPVIKMEMLCSDFVRLSEEDSREILCLCWKVPYDVINLTLSNLGQSGCVPLTWSHVKGWANPIPVWTGRLFSVFVMDVVFKAWKHSFSPSHIHSSVCASLSFLQQGSRSGQSWRWPVAGPGAATQDMGAASHSCSCLVLQPVELLHCPHLRWEEASRSGNITPSYSGCLWNHCSSHLLLKGKQSW